MAIIWNSFEHIAITSLLFGVFFLLPLNFFFAFYLYAKKRQKRRLIITLLLLCISVLFALWVILKAYRYSPEGGVFLGFAPNTLGNFLLLLFQWFWYRKIKAEAKE